MRRVLNNTSILLKISLSFASILAIVLVLGTISAAALVEVNAAAVEVRDQWLPNVGLLGRLLSAIKDCRTGGAVLAIGGPSQDMAVAEEKLLKKVALINSLRAQYQPLIKPNTPDASAIRSFDVSWPPFQASLTAMLDRLHAKDIGGAQAIYLGDNRRLYGASADPIEDDLAGFMIQGSGAAAGRGVAVYSRTIGMIAAAVGIAAAMCALCGFAIIRGVSSPVVRMTQAMTRLAQNDLTVTVAGTERRDELGAMARAVAVFKQGMVDSYQPS